MGAHDTCMYVHREGGLEMLFAFISPLDRRILLKYKSIPGEWV